ncbi:hypothetical protein [Streptomyces sp. bgisy126]|uniref:hypothetical protein n=1 Tax=unclassified Streptomyces TaxID=2593676 RepID=UPI003EBB5F37
MRVGYAFDGDGTCISDACHHATAFLGKAGAEYHLPVPERARDLTVLVVGERVTNVL